MPSIRQAVSVCGQMRLDYCQGLKVGMIPMPGAKVVTEIEALRILTGVETVHVASGGYSDCQGAVTLVSDGDKKSVEKAIGIIEEIKGEAPIEAKRGLCENCPSGPPGLPEEHKPAYLPCQYIGRAQKDLPGYLKTR